MKRYAYYGLFACFGAQMLFSCSGRNFVPGKDFALADMVQTIPVEMSCTILPGTSGAAVWLKDTTASIICIIRDGPERAGTKAGSRIRK